MIQHEHIKVHCSFPFVFMDLSRHTVFLHHSTAPQWWNTTGTGSGLVSGSSSSPRRPPTWWKRPRSSRGSVTALWKVSGEKTHPAPRDYMENSYSCGRIYAFRCFRQQPERQLPDPARHLWWHQTKGGTFDSFPPPGKNKLTRMKPSFLFLGWPGSAVWLPVWGPDKAVCYCQQAEIYTSGAGQVRRLDMCHESERQILLIKQTVNCFCGFAVLDLTSTLAGRALWTSKVDRSPPSTGQRMAIWWWWGQNSFTGLSFRF